ncbi:MAG: molybdopterin cofactor-binding domain-containing protein [Betaproteobacteria bacterium]
MNKPAELPQRVRPEPDGTVSIATGKVELGQGIHSALAQIAAEELWVDLDKIRILPPSTEYCPDEGVTSGSLSIQDAGRALRKACAELLAAPEKPAARYGIVGTSAARLDLPAKFAGRPSFIQDMTLPGMLHGRIIRPFHAFKSVKDIPSIPGLVRDGSFVGVLAEREEEAIAAAKKARAGAKWEEGARVPDDIYAWLKENVAEEHVAKQKADPAAKARGVKRVQATYRKPYIAHASIGPSCAIAQWQNGRLQVWTHSQGIFNLRRELALIFSMPEEGIVVRHVEGAGCYGHNGADDAALDAALLARAAHGRAVRVQWSREDEFAWEPCGPAMLVSLDAQLDAAGSIVSWRHDLWSNGHTRRPGRAAKPVLAAAAHLATPFELAPPSNPPLPAGGADRNAIPIYDSPDLLVVNHYVREAPRNVSSLRSLGGFGNVFAIESFMDELAAAAGVDPTEFRLRYLSDSRAKAVIQKAIDTAGSFRKSEGRGRGLGFARYKNIGAYCAVVAEVEAGRELRVTRLVAAVDVGLAVNPDGVANQGEGGCIQAASWALKEAWRPGILGWEDYPMLRFSEVPQVEVSILQNQLPSVGAGECAMGPAGAAIANALCDALGVRVRELPLTAERIAAAL